MITPEDLVRREVHYCVSTLVATLARASGMSQSAIDADREVWELLNAAAELSYPIDDWEEAARGAGWAKSRHPGRFEHGDGEELEALDWRDVCEKKNIDPYQWEIFEHWIVSDWLADKLEAKGEKIDRDFAGMTIWARTTSGQAIAADSVIEAICAELNRA